MKIIRDIPFMQDEMLKTRKTGLKIGLVPTMGFLHEGHTSLIENSVRDCDVTAVSIFVNPAQFGKGEDFEKYPRDEKRDISIIKKHGADYAFIPRAEDMYEKVYKTFVSVKDMDRVMCGKFRPGHFKGVCTVVLKLINISFCDVAYFGLKDYQQFLIIKKMTGDLNLPVKIQGCPIVRDKDGLALSSRNKYLSVQERENATVLYNAIKLAAGMVKKGDLNIETIKKEAVSLLESNPSVKKIDYFDFRDPDNLKAIKTLIEKPGAGRKTNNRRILIASAIWIGSTRLIDNILV